MLDQWVARTFPTGPCVVPDQFEDLLKGHHGLIPFNGSGSNARKLQQRGGR
jgi:hypothetical protein